VAGGAVLDLFAGSGAVGIEAVSRGARSGVLVEPEAAALRAAAERLGATPSELRILGEEARSAVRRLILEGDRFDLVFADPPYHQPFDAELLAAIPALLAPGGRFVIQQDSRRPDLEVPGLQFEQRRAYGRNVFLFFGMR
jgi:16S rRNA (guanine966-N2)-methyltransferase